MIETLQALNKYYDLLTIETTDSLASWAKFQIVAIKDDTTITVPGYELDKILQELLIMTVKRAAN